MSFSEVAIRVTLRNKIRDLIVKTNKEDVMKIKKIELHSKEFNRVLKNMQLEGLEMNKDFQERAISLLNSNSPITSEKIKEQFHKGNVL